jgi:hypothetical protein
LDVILANFDNKPFKYPTMNYQAINSALIWTNVYISTHNRVKFNCCCVAIYWYMFLIIFLICNFAHFANKILWSSTKRTSSSSIHLKLTFSRHDIAEK